MKTHIAQHLRPFKCTICGSGFMTVFQLEKHTYLKHEMDKEQEESANVAVVKSEVVDGERNADIEMYDDGDGNGECDDDYYEKNDEEADDGSTKKKSKRKIGINFRTHI